jgi:hypothetical protein
MHQPSSDDGVRLASFVPSLRTRVPVSPDEVADFSVSRDRDGLASLSAEPIRLAGAIFIYGGGEARRCPSPRIEGDVHFLAGPVESAPPKVFNVKALMAQLEPLIKGEKCGGNVCAHMREYLLPKGKLNSRPQ